MKTYFTTVCYDLLRARFLDQMTRSIENLRKNECNTEGIVEIPAFLIKKNGIVRGILRILYKKVGFV